LNIAFLSVNLAASTDHHELLDELLAGSFAEDKGSSGNIHLRLMCLLVAKNVLPHLPQELSFDLAGKILEKVDRGELSVSSTSLSEEGFQVTLFSHMHLSLLTLF
jgi:hypothetical protein